MRVMMLLNNQKETNLQYIVQVELKIHVHESLYYKIQSINARKNDRFNYFGKSKNDLELDTKPFT